MASRLPIVPAIVTVALSASGTAVWLHLPVAGSRRSAKSLPSTSSSALTHRILSVAETSSIACAFVGVIAVTIGTLRSADMYLSDSDTSEHAGMFAHGWLRKMISWPSMTTRMIAVTGQIAEIKREAVMVGRFMSGG